MGKRKEQTIDGCSLNRKTLQTTKIVSKPPTKWHNRTAPQLTVHRTA